MKLKIQTKDEGRALQLAQLRAERDRRLSASDWSQVPDAPLSAAELQLWKDYRQTLRDLPSAFEQHSDVDSVTWPDPPARLPAPGLTPTRWQQLLTWLRLRK